MIDGGALLAVGGQGCVFAPAHVRTSKSEEVTKIVKNITAVNEYNISKYLQRLDPQNLYGIYATKIHKIKKEDVQRETLMADTKTCKFLDNKKIYSNYLSLTYPRYASDVSEMSITTSKKKILFGLFTLWSSLAFLHKSNVVHLDIRLQNIGFLNKRFVFSDWGHAVVANCDNMQAQLKRIQHNIQILNRMPSWLPTSLRTFAPKSCDDLHNYFLFVDVYSTCHCTLELLAKYDIKNVLIEMMCKTFMKHQNYTETAPDILKTIIFNVLKKT
jgi:serine/threonine protein kinase